MRVKDGLDDVRVTEGFICTGDQRFYLSARCGFGHEHRPAKQVITTTYTLEECR